MKKHILFLSLLMAGIISGLHAQTQFWVDDFEGLSSSSGTRTPENNGGVGGPPFTSYFCRTPANGTVSQSVPFTGFQGTNYWAGEDHDAAGTGFAGAGTSAMSVRQQDITWTGINIAGKTNLSFTGSFAANSTNQPFDNRNACSGGATTNTDYVILQYRIDAGPWNDGLRFFTNGALTGKYLFLETTGDSCGDGAQLLNVFHDFSFDLVGTGTTLTLRLLVYSEGGNEEWGVDNFRLFETTSCTAPVIVTNPPNRSVCSGNNTTLPGSSTGATTYQWQVDDGSGFTDLSNTGPYSGVTSSTLNITGATGTMNGYKYRYTAINGVATCSTNSGFGTLSISSISTTATQTNVSCNSGNSGAASVSATGGIGGSYTYNWSPAGGIGATATSLAAGVYTLSINDAISCPATAIYTITQPSALITSTAVTNVACNGGSNGVASITASGGAGSYTYLWSNGGSTSAITGLLAGAYTATVTDANSCISIKNAIVTQPSALVTSTAVTNVSCNGGSNGTATITASGGAGGYTYLWSTGNSSSAITGRMAGAYTATVTDANSCTSIKSAIITQPSALVTTTAVTNVACNGGANGSATITASGGVGGYTYLWSNGATTSAISGLLAGAYSATVTDANSCTSIKSAIITQPSALVTTTAVTNVACNGGSNGSATITASGGVGGYTYLWSNGASTSAISGLLAGVYSATVTDANSCTSIKSAVVTQPSALATTTAVTNVACNGGANGSATITASGGVGGYTYLWSNGATTSAISGLLAGAYSATVTDANSCTSIKSAVVTQPSALATTTAVTNVACNGGSNGVASITASGGAGSYTYLWSNGATTSAITGMMAGAYSATVTDANSCTSTKSAVITQPSALATTTAVTNVACNGGSNGVASITASGGAGSYTYLWSNGATTSAITGMMAGAYSATVTDANSCTSIKSAVITQPSALATTTAVTNVACNGGSNGSATITASGGAGSYTYLWSNGATTSAITGMMAGAYSATVTDANSCTSIKNAVVTQPSALATTTAVTNVACNGGSNGSATITASGGAGSYTYLWSNGATTSAITGMMAGAYSATVTDANSCTSIKSAVVTQPSALATTTAVTNVACNSGSNGSATITASGGAGSYTYLWSNGATTSAISGLLASAYSATVTDANSCTSIKSAVVTQPSAIVTTTAVTNVTCNSGANGSASITASGGAGSYTYLWSNGATTSAISGLLAGAYSATVTDANSCTSIKAVNVSQPAVLTLTASANTSSICQGGSVTLTANSSGGTGTISYSWISGPATATYMVAPSVSAVYTVNASDANNCSTAETVSVSVISTPTISVNSATICSGNSIAIVPTGANSYTITGGNYTVSPNTTTSYTVSGSTNGCAANNAVSTISVNTTPTLTVNNATICSNNSVAIVPTGANSYTITGGNFTVTPLTTTSYSVTGQSAAGCAASNTVVSTVSVNTTPTLTVNSATVCSGNSVAIVPTGAGSYTITGGSYTVSPNVTTSYSVTGTGSNGCAASNTAVSTVSVNTTPTVTVNSATVCSGNSVAIVPTGAASYTITGNNYTVTPNTTTSYTVTGTTNGCSSANAVSTISVNTTPTITLNGGSICPGNSYTLAASGAGSYTYSGGANIVSPSTNTTYSATGTGTNGCPASNTAVATVSVVNTLTISVSGSTNVCSGRTTTLTATGAATYSWSTGIITNTIALSPAANTTYTVYGASGTCNNNAVVTLSVLTTPTVTVNSATICSGTSVTLVPAGASSYTITGGNFTVTPTANSSYSVIGSAVNGCVSNSVVSTVSVNTTPTVTVNSASICSGASATLVPAGASSYTITGGSLTVTPTANTAYTVSGTAVNGCVSSPVVSTITVYSLPTITVNSGAICPGNSFTLVPAGAATYTYSNGSNVIVNPVATAAYSVTGTSAQGCHATNTAVATVSVVNTLSITVTGPAAICAGETATLTANGATTYSWNTGDATDNIIISPAATTDYTVSGASGTCSNTAVVTLSVNPLPTVTVNSGSVCLGSAFNILPTGADTYSISGNIFTVSPTATQSYSVTGTDLNGCVSAEVTSTVTVNALPVVTAAASNATMCISETASLTASGATTYLWSNTQTDAVIAVTATVAGTETYTVTGTDANGCMNTATVTQVFDNCTALHKLSSSLNLNLYPNPNNGEFVIETTNNVNVTITNALGQVVHTENTSGAKTTINITHLDNGIYFANIKQGNNTSTVKIVKQ